MFNVNDLYELLKTHDFEDVRAAFDLALDEAEQRRKCSVYKHGTHELPTEFYNRLDTNDTTMEDVVLLMYTVLYRDYPEMRESFENIDIPAETKLIGDILNMLTSPTSKNVQKLMDQMFGSVTTTFNPCDNTTNSTSSKEQEKKKLSDKEIIKDFLQIFS